MKEGYWVVRTYEAGAVGEKTKFWVQGRRPTGKSRRREKSDIRKQEQNEYSAQKSLARLINANYTGGDLVLGLDYSPKGMKRLMKRIEKMGIDWKELDEESQRDLIWAAADREMDNCLRRVKYSLKKIGVELKAVYITSDMDGETGDAVRVHHHLVVNKQTRDAFVAAWESFGHVSWSPMWDYQEDRTPIAEYFIKQVRRIPDAKKYRSTRNLVRPEPKDRVVLSDAELRVPKGAKLLHRNEFKPGRPQYIRYVLPPKRSARPEPPDGPGE